MSENPKKFKSKYQLKLVDEKRAFVVIALSDKFTLAGKAAAANALAHYDSRVGYAYASVPRMTIEAGYAPSSTQTLNRGLLEMEKLGAFKVVRRTGAKNTHHICPNMAWFRAEYARLLESGKVKEDEFADIRDHDQEEEKSGSEEEKSGSQPNNSGSELDKSGSQPDNPGSKPDEENEEKRTAEENQDKRTNLRGANDNRRVDLTNGHRGPAAPFPRDAFDQFWTEYPNKIAKPVACDSFNKIEKAGQVEFNTIMDGLRKYVKKKDDRPWCNPSTWLNQARWEDQPGAEPTKTFDRPKRRMAI